MQEREKQIEEMAKDIESTIELRECESWHCNGCQYEKYSEGYMCDSIKQAEHFYEKGYRKQEWISVEERLPDGHGDFLVVVKSKLLWNTEWEDCVGLATYNCSEIPSVNGWDYETRDGYQYIITHWMPLPEAPKMKGGEE